MPSWETDVPTDLWVLPKGACDPPGEQSTGGEERHLVGHQRSAIAAQATAWLQVSRLRHRLGILLFKAL